MQKPKLMLFRTKNDMREVRRLGFENIGYVYNFFDNVNTNIPEIFLQFENFGTE